MTNQQAHAIFGRHIANGRGIQLFMPTGRSIQDVIADERLYVVADHNGLLECDSVITKTSNMGPYYLTWLVAHDGRAVRVRADDIADDISS
jgi:hypothetical protein